jgi:hypothetical protein
MGAMPAAGTAAVGGLQLPPGRPCPDRLDPPSWEERFAAVPVQLNNSAVTLQIGAPPRRLADAQRLVAQLIAIADVPVDEALTESDRFARQLLGELPPGGHQTDFSQTLWYVQLKHHPLDILEEMAPPLPSDLT